MSPRPQQAAVSWLTEREVDVPHIYAVTPQCAAIDLQRAVICHPRPVDRAG